MAKIPVRKTEIGQSLTEYLILVAFVAIAAVGVTKSFGTKLKDRMKGAEKRLDQIKYDGS